MKTSCEWLTDYVDLPWAPAELASELTMAGLEVEAIETMGDLPEQVIVCEILSREPHPNADRLSVCQVDVGAGESLQIVCGAPNCDAGQRAVLAGIGAQLAPDFTVRKAKLRGVASFGMLCSEEELGLGDDHSGIMILDPQTAVGTPLRDVLGTDTVIDWEVTPNRPDWLCHVGIAREIGALTRQPLRLPPTGLTETAGRRIGDHASVIVTAADLCPRYTARLIENVQIVASPEWLQRRLRAVGLRPINNVVDITNYVMLECGQPLHAFDFHRLAGATIVVRRAADGEILRTLDGTEHTLSSDHLLIADAERGVALAGVMGGENSEISPDTSTVLLESAAFAPGNIRATAKRLGISTDSSHRFERGVDIEMVAFASARAAYLICELAGGTLAEGVIDIRQNPYDAPEIAFRFARVRHVLGADIADEEMIEILGALGLQEVARDARSCTVRVPSHRLDLSREIDLVEEIARLYGLNRIPLAQAATAHAAPRSADAYYGFQRVRDDLLGLGLTECLSYSMISEADAVAQSSASGNDLVAISNALSAEFAVMRPSVLTGVLKSVAHNIAHGIVDLRLFELGRVYSAAPSQPEERHEAAIALTGRRHPERFSKEKNAVYDFFDLKGLLEDWLAARHIDDVVVENAEHPVLRSGVAARLSVGGTTVAVLGEAAEALTADMRLRHPVYLALVEVEALVQASPGLQSCRPLPQYPATSRDVAFVAEQALQHRQVEDVIERTAGAWLESIDLFDIYEDETSIGAGRKSMAYSLTFRSPERTLKDAEVDRVMAKVAAELQARLPIEYR